MRQYAILNKKQRAKLIEYLGEKQLPIKVLIQDITSQRDVNLNDAYWVALTYASEYSGHTKNELHTYFKKRFLTEYSPEPGSGEWKIRVKSTTELSNEEFAMYFEQVRAFLLVEWNLDTPTRKENFNNQNHK